MVKRLIFGIIAAAIAIVCLALGGWVAIGLGFLLTLAAQGEMLGAIRNLKLKPMAWPGYAFALLYIPAYLFRQTDAIWALFSIIIILTLCIHVFRPSFSLKDVFASLLPLLYPLPLFVFLMMAIRMPAPAWLSVLLTGIASACLTDVFALYTGITIGKHKLAPEISPKKTVEGAIGGFILGGFGGGVLLYFAQQFWGASYPLWVFLASSALCSIAGQMGDLVASSIKRFTNIKDFGKLIPGHGGVMDRLDSVLFGVMVAYIFFQFLVVGKF